ncbi:MAG: quinone-dependent dihydroorotate dehydrogenase [Patescibacteria group bacterium]
MLYQALIRPILFKLSSGDHEEAHLLAKRMIRGIQHVPPILYAIESLCQARHNPRPVEAFGITFPNRVGLAAGFDKDAEMIPFMQAIGFGFVEIGSVLPRYQKGNDRPRMFRIEELKGIINRMGFNSAGASTVEANLREHRKKIRIPIGISLGKMKTTPLENAADDYLEVMGYLYRFGDYFVINISSPNTPGLRELQTRSYIGKLVKAVVDLSTRLGGKPVLVKLAPDMTNEEMLEAVEAALENGISGIIISNTTTERPYLGYQSSPPAHIEEIGGWSGEWLFEKTLEKVGVVREHYPDVPIIGVGGINSAEHELRMLDQGATLIQILTGLVYEGPGLVEELRFIR